MNEIEKNSPVPCCMKGCGLVSSVRILVNVEAGFEEYPFCHMHLCFARELIEGIEKLTPVETEDNNGRETKEGGE